MSEKEFYKFPSIESFHNRVKLGGKKFVGTMLFNVFPKLHGTNAAIVFKDGEAYAQSRSRVITPEDDNFGFAAFVESLNLPKGETTGDFIVYGEWCGKGIQKEDAISKIDRKVFVIFAVMFLTNGVITTNPAVLEQIKESFFDNNQDVYFVTPLTQVAIDFNEKKGLQNISERINEVVEQFESVDPWVASTFGVEGSGEGVVVAPNNCSRDAYSDWAFKAKTKAHTTNKSSKPAKVYVEVSSDVVDFADRFATEPRFKQAVRELQLDFDMKNTGQFLKWIAQDVMKESKDEVEASELDWKQRSKEITTKARLWWQQQCNIC